MTLTSPDKIVYSKGKITKQDVANYYRHIAPKILPHLKGRTLSLVRCPNGVGECHYFRQNPTVSSVKELLSHVQMNTIEFHINTPDIMVFDLDPGENVSLQRLRRGARDLKSILDELGLQSTLKTTGGKGYHVMVPYPENISGQIAQLLEAKWPAKYTTNIRKDAREGKIFIDYLRNGPSSTHIAPYSLRARPTPTIALPISWEELETTMPNHARLCSGWKCRH